jgi:chromate reductase
MTQLLGISGSLRAESVNRKLIREAARLGEFGDYIEADLRLPLYDGDLEAASGIPSEVQTLADQIMAADAVVISTPEYNKGISGVLKNALDWVSRVDEKPWTNKPLAILSATAGRTGGERAQANLRLSMVPFRPRILQGPEVLVAGAHAEFNEAGQLSNPLYTKALSQLMADLAAEIR